MTKMGKYKGGKRQSLFFYKSALTKQTINWSRFGISEYIDLV